MENLRFDLLFIGTWALGFVILTAGVTLTWIHRLPGTYLSDFINGPKGQHSLRALHQYTDTMRLVQPQKRTLIYGVLLTGSTICAAAIVIPFVLAIFIPGAYD